MKIRFSRLIQTSNFTAAVVRFGIVKYHFTGNIVILIMYHYLIVAALLFQITRTSNYLGDNILVVVQIGEDIREIYTAYFLPPTHF